MARMASSKTAVRRSTCGTQLLGAFMFVGSQQLLFGRTDAPFFGSTPVIKPGPFGLNDPTQGRAVTRRRAGGTPPGPGAPDWFQGILAQLFGWSNGNEKWQTDPDATEWLRELAKEEWKDTATRPEAAVQVLRLTKTLLPEYGQSGPAVFSRSTTRMAWKATFELLEEPEETRRVVILGRPGIGKSRSLFCGLRDLLRRADPPRVIIFEARPSGVVFRFAKDSSGSWEASRMGMEAWDPTSSADLGDARNWYLIDACEVSDRDYKFAAKCVKASSPDTGHWTNFIKDGGACTYMGDWTLDEVEAAYEYLETAVDIKEIRRRHEIVGGNLRLLLGLKLNFETYVKQMDSDADDEALVKAALKGVLQATPSKIPTRLFTYATSDGVNYTIAFVTPKAMEKVLAAHYKQVLDQISIPRNPKAGFDLEDFVTKFFLVGGLQRIKSSGDPIRLDAWELTYVQNTSSGKVSTYQKKQASQTKKDFAIAPNKTLRNFDTEGAFESAWKDAVENQSLGGKVWQAPPGYPAFDILVDYNHVMSITTSSTHSLSGKFCEQLEKVGVSEGCITFTFLTMQDPKKFKVEKKTQGVAANLTKAGATVQVVQIPRTPASIP